jgi:hypothetical protein
MNKLNSISKDSSTDYVLYGYIKEQAIEVNGGYIASDIWLNAQSKISDPANGITSFIFSISAVKH